jgi:NAD(P)-dependent dehydrogenase (short-subunit alcohol dehydrogenase family)
MDLGLRGCAAIVGGASSGMGRAIARRLAEEGCDVTLFARRAELLDEAVAEISALTDGGRGRVVNLTSMAVKEINDGLLLSNALRPAVNGWAKHLSREEGPHAVTVKLDRAGLHRHRSPPQPVFDRIRTRGGPAARRAVDPAAPIRGAGGDRVRGRVSLLDRGRLYHRRHPARRRRPDARAAELTCDARASLS